MATKTQSKTTAKQTTTERRRDDEKTTVSFYLPVTVVERIEKMAEAADRSASWTVANILREHLGLN